ncbi:MAG: hypothetical protein NC412_01980 [Roseburia sp.]|nr:hypothetical protein [Roseburia sp.]
MKKEKLLDILVKERVHGALENALNYSNKYKLAKIEHDKACKALDEISLDKKQDKIIDKVLCTANHCTAVYGEIAYRQGLRDGIRLVQELKISLLKENG